MAHNQVYQSEAIRDFRGTIHYYLEIDSNIHGTLKLCEPGVTDTDPLACDWLESISGFEEGEGQVQELSFVLNKHAASRVATEPLENHVVRVYRYRTHWFGRELIREGRVWSATDQTGQGSFPFRIIGNMATIIDGDLPDRTFRGSGWYGYYQAPEDLKGKGIPIVIGSVNGAVPALAKAGGWGTLAVDLPAYTHPWTGAIQLDTGRGSSFHGPGLSSTLTEAIPNKTQHDWPIASTAGAVMDQGYFWVVCYKSEQVYEITRARGVGPTQVLCAYRGLITPAQDVFTTGDGVYEIGLVKIDQELIAYRRAAVSGLTEILRGVNGIYSVHKKGARVQEYLPTFIWVANSTRVANNSFTKDDLFFFDSAKNQLVSNPFADISIRTNDPTIESGQRLAVVILTTTVAPVFVGLTSTYTGNATAHENIDMDSVTTEDDDSTNWTDTANAIDEDTVEPHANPQVDPTTSAMYSPVITEETIYFQTLADYSNYWTDIANAHDTDPDTFSAFVLSDPSVVESLIKLNLGTTPTGYADIIRIDATIRATWDKLTAAGTGLTWGGYSLVVSTQPSASAQTATLFAYQASEQINTEHRDTFRDDAVYDNGAENLQAVFVGYTTPLQQSVAGFYGAKLTIKRTSHGVIKVRNTGAVTNKAATTGTAIQIYVDGGTWELNYDGAWDGVTDAWHEVTGSGWIEVEIPGSSAWTADEDWQKYIRIRPKYPDQTGYLFHVRLVNWYTNAGNWAGIDRAIDGDLTTAAVYDGSDAGGHYGEFYRDVALAETSLIKAVRIRITYSHNLNTRCQVGIGAASGGSSPPLGITWHDISASSGKSTVYIDVTNDHPNPENWSWEDFNTGGTGRDYSIYLNVRGATGTSLELYDIAWDIVSEVSSIDPSQHPLVVNMSGCYDFVLNGSYTANGGLITNPADVERYILQERLGVPGSRIDETGYATLRAYFDALCVNGVKCAGMIPPDLESADDWLRRFRSEFGYHVDEDAAGRLTPRAWPAITAASVATLNDDNIISFQSSKTGMDELCNFPIAYYNPQYYNSNYWSAIAFDVRTTRAPLIRRKWNNPLLVESTGVRYQHKNTMEISELLLIDEWGNDFSSQYAIAESSYKAYGQWFRMPFYYNFVRDAETAKALVAEKIRRFAFQRYRFQIEADSSVADLLDTWNVITVQNQYVPIIRGKTTPVAHSLHGTIRSVKCVILKIVPNGRTRSILCEVI